MRVPGPLDLHVAVGALDVANARRLSGRLDHDALSAAQCAARERARDHRADALQREDAIHRQARLAEIARRRQSGDHFRESGLQIIEAPPAHNRRRNDRRVGERRVAQFCANRGNRGLFVLREIDFRQRHHGMTHAEISENLQVLFGLRHPAIIGCDDQQGQVHRSHARDHVFHEVLVAGHIHDSEHERCGIGCGLYLQPTQILAGRGKLQVREAEIDGDAARLLLGQTIGVGAGQGFDQRALAMIHVACGGQDEMLHGGHSLLHSLFFDGCGLYLQPTQILKAGLPLNDGADRIHQFRVLRSGKSSANRV